MEIEKLELKHIYGYIFHGLHAMIQDVVCDIEGVDLVWESTVISERVNYKLSEIKPILRPLSDLTKEIEVNGEKFVPIEKLAEIEEMACLEYSLEFFETSLKYLPFWIVQKLYEWHFDIHELIENNLAVNINNLP